MGIKTTLIEELRTRPRWLASAANRRRKTWARRRATEVVMRWTWVGPTLLNLKEGDDEGSFGIDAKPAINTYHVTSCSIILLLACIIAVPFGSVKTHTSLEPFNFKNNVNYSSNELSDKWLQPLFVNKIFISWDTYSYFYLTFMLKYK